MYELRSIGTTLLSIKDELSRMQSMEGPGQHRFVKWLDKRDHMRIVAWLNEVIESLKLAEAEVSDLEDEVTEYRENVGEE